MSMHAAAWSAILSAAQPEVARLTRALADPRASQVALLDTLVASNRETSFGREHDFARIRSLDDYRRAVPIRTYDGLREWIEAAANGSMAVLTRAPIVAFEETGGTTSGPKLIPYTAAALAGFRAAVLPWLADLAHRRPGIKAGHAYVSVSPALRSRRWTAGGAPIGLESEGSYLGGDLASPFASLLAVSPEIAGIGEIDRWRTATLAGLVSASDLSFVSVWSPTFFDQLVDALEAQPEPVLHVLYAQGPSAQAMRETVARLENALTGSQLDTYALWPQLDTISCWADGASQPYAQRLAERFHHATIEPKGLLATEAAVSIPWGGADGCVPALSSTFIEFIGEDDIPRLADEVEPGASYRVVVTTAGGLYRYDLGDRVRCVATSARVPRLRFEGRDASVSDLVGEKLTEAFVADALGASVPYPAALVPQVGPPAYYLLYVDAQVGAVDSAQVCGALELRLAANPQYAYARAMGQLGSLRLAFAPRYFDRLARRAASEGRRLADVKPAALLSQASMPDWE